jgi:hypothetical protein
MTDLPKELYFAVMPKIARAYELFAVRRAEFGVTEMSQSLQGIPSFVMRPFQVWPRPMDGVVITKAVNAETGRSLAEDIAVAALRKITAGSGADQTKRIAHDALKEMGEEDENGYSPATPMECQA